MGDGRKGKTAGKTATQGVVWVPHSPGEMPNKLTEKNSLKSLREM